MAHPTKAQYVAEDVYTDSAPDVDGFFGEDIAVVGTLNGRQILVVGSPGATDNGGAFLVNADDGSIRATLTTQRPTFGGEFGKVVGVVGDVSGDGFPDVLVGAPREDYIEPGSSATDAGVAYIFDGDTGDFLLELQSSGSNVLTGRRFGTALAGIGDVNGDNVPDVAVGAPDQASGGAGQAGKVYVFSGADASVLQVLVGAEVNSGRFGASISSAGDIVGTAVSDFAIGAPGEDVTTGGSTFNQAGRVYVFDGDTFSSTAIVSDSPENGGNFGNTLAELPVPTGSDLIVGARREDTAGLSDAGRAYIVDGANLTGTKTILESGTAEAQGAFATSLSALSDINNDGVPDIIAGAPEETISGVGNAGRAYVFSGADGALIATLTSPSLENSRFGLSVAGTTLPIVSGPREDVGSTLQAGRVHRFVPEIELVDGRDGENFAPADGTPGTSANPVGRFKLSTTVSGATLSEISITNNTPPPTGVTSIELWSSTDAIFDASSDTELAATSYADNVSFSSLGAGIPSGETYYFVVVDLDNTADGDVEPVLPSESSLSLTDGQLTAYNGTAASTFTDAFLSADATTLPVELASFSGAFSDQSVVLTWSTLSETDNDGFTVERRPTDGSDWTDAGFVEGSGTTSQTRSYRFTDTDLPTGVRTLQYRLRQQDVDGSTSLSKPITVRFSTEGPLAIARVYPNPATNQVNVDVNLPEALQNSEATLTLFDLLGRRVQTTTLPLAETSAMQMRVADLPSGTYFLRIMADGQTDTQRLTIVR